MLYLKNFLSYPPNIRDILHPAVVMKTFLNVAENVQYKMLHWDTSVQKIHFFCAELYSHLCFLTIFYNTKSLTDLKIGTCKYIYLRAIACF